MLSEERYDAAARRCLESAMGHAELSGFARIHCSHIVLAGFEAEREFLDRILQKKFAGLRAETVEDCLRDILEIAGPNSSDGAAAFPGAGLPGADHLDNTAVSLLQRSEELTTQWALPAVPVAALIAAGLQAPDAYLAEALGDVDVKQAELSSLVEELANRCAGDSAASAIEVFAADGQVRWPSFGPLAREALQALAPRAAVRVLRDADLLHSLMSRDSRLAEALHIWRLPVARIRATLAAMTGGAAGEPGGATELHKDRIGRLLRSVMAAAAEIARAERCGLISESHLLRAHLDSVAGGSGNIYERLGIDTRRLHGYLSSYPQDREIAEPEPAEETIGEVEDIPAYLRSRIIGQEAAIERASRALMVMRTGLGSPKAVAGKFLFLGATGVGKTELARAMAEVAFGPESGVPDAHFIKIDCGNLTQQHHISQLLGASPEYAGYGEGGALTNALGNKPASVVRRGRESAPQHLAEPVAAVRRRNSACARRHRP